MTATPASGPGPAYWEDLNGRAWGRYITARETAAIEAAQRAAPAPRRALDVGCGGGRWTRLLLDRGWAVTSIDVDPASVRACAELNPEADCSVVPADAEKLPAGDESVSLLLCIEVQPVVQADWFLPEVRRVLAPGGRMVLVTWNRWSFRGLATDAASWVRERRPHRFYRVSYRAWRRELRASGFAVAAERGMCWFPFGRASDSRLIPAAAALEGRLGLDRLPSVSPWVLVTAERLDDFSSLERRPA